MIREATENDLDRVSALGSRSLEDGPYAGIIKDNPEQGRKFAEWVLANGSILLAEMEGKIIGLLGFTVAAHHFSGQLYAAELMWYVEEEHRKGGIALKLLWEAERRAKEFGAESMVFTAPNNDVAALYSKFGYKQLEVVFRKVL